MNAGGNTFIYFRQGKCERVLSCLGDLFLLLQTKSLGLQQPAPTEKPGPAWSLARYMMLVVVALVMMIRVSLPLTSIKQVMNVGIVSVTVV